MPITMTTVSIISSNLSKNSLFMVCYLLYFARRIHNSQCSYASNNEKKHGKRAYFNSIHFVLIDADHDLPQDENYSGVYNECYSQSMYLEIFDDAPEKFYNNKHGQYIRYHGIKPCCYCRAFENHPQIYEYPRNAHHKGKDHKGYHQLDDYVYDLFEQSHFEIIDIRVLHGYEMDVKLSEQTLYACNPAEIPDVHIKGVKAPVSNLLFLTLPEKQVAGRIKISEIICCKAVSLPCN